MSIDVEEGQFAILLDPRQQFKALYIFQEDRYELLMGRGCPKFISTKMIREAYIFDTIFRAFKKSDIYDDFDAFTLN